MDVPHRPPGARRAGTRETPGRRRAGGILPAVLAGAAGALLLAACGVAESGLTWRPGQTATPTGLAVTWATTDSVASAAGGPVVELEIVVENRGRWATASTSILWEPGFAAAATFVQSEPSPWRVRVDARGWGVLDTAGVLPGRSGTFRVLFDAPAASRPAPRIVVVADGRRVVADTVADGRIAAADTAPRQRLFERGPLAALADGAPFVPASPHRAFPFAVGLAVLLGLSAAGGTAAAFRASAAGPPGRWGGC